MVPALWGAPARTHGPRRHQPRFTGSQQTQVRPAVTSLPCSLRGKEAEKTPQIPTSPTQALLLLGAQVNTLSGTGVHSRDGRAAEPGAFLTCQPAWRRSSEFKTVRGSPVQASVNDTQIQPEPLRWACKGIWEVTTGAMPVSGLPSGSQLPGAGSEGRGSRLRTASLSQ